MRGSSTQTWSLDPTATISPLFRAHFLPRHPCLEQMRSGYNLSNYGLVFPLTRRARETCFCPNSIGFIRFLSLNRHFLPSRPSRLLPHYNEMIQRLLAGWWGGLNHPESSCLLLGFIRHWFVMQKGSWKQIGVGIAIRFVSFREMER